MNDTRTVKLKYFPKPKLKMVYELTINHVYLHIVVALIDTFTSILVLNMGLEFIFLGNLMQNFSIQKGWIQVSK